ncbi:MAG: hypothetical protein HY820_41495 [Acidobacteria bacterium]|nr:hypothetical protein [Acidobacteriota bacterium]
MLIDNPRGGFAFLKGISPYSAGAVSLPGFTIEHARFLRPLPLKTGFDAVDAHLKRLKRPRQALCGMELRSPKPFTFAGFNQFNAGYIDILKQWDIPFNGLNPVARTNVAPEVGAPTEPCLYGFSYTIPANGAPKSFIVAGAGELPEGSLDPKDLIRSGETNVSALQEKARFVMGLMDGRVLGLGVTWADVTVTEIYTVHNIHSYLVKEVLQRMGKATDHGCTWHFARPPIQLIEYEMDLRGCRRELVL